MADTIMLELGKNESMVLLTNLNMALTHPANIGSSSPMAKFIAKVLGDAITTNWPDLAWMVTNSFKPDPEFYLWVVRLKNACNNHPVLKDKTIEEFNIQDLRGFYIDEKPIEEVLKYFEGLK